MDINEQPSKTVAVFDLIAAIAALVFLACVVYFVIGSGILGWFF